VDATVIWALLTGAITGGAWVGIVLLRRQHRASARQLQLVEEADRRLDELADVGERLAEVEERLNFAERLLAQDREEHRLPPPPSIGPNEPRRNSDAQEEG
jgi:hypothetical protein